MFSYIFRSIKISLSTKKVLPYLQSFLILSSSVRNNHLVFLEYGGHSAVPFEDAGIQPHFCGRELGKIGQESQPVLGFHQPLLHGKNNVWFYFLNVSFQFHQIFCVAGSCQSFLCDLFIIIAQSKRERLSFLRNLKSCLPLTFLQW